MVYKRQIAIAIFASLPVLASACSATPDGNSAGAQELSQSVTFHMQSWGHLETHWMFSRDGSGEVWRVPDNRSMSNYEIQKFHAHFEAKDRSYFLEQIDAMADKTRGGVRCDVVISDMQYGYLEWKIGNRIQRYDYNFGCKSKATDEIYYLIAVAGEIVRRHAVVDAKPFAIEHVGQR